MFLRPHFRRRHGQREAYWALVESYRTERGPRQRTVAYLGLMDEAGRLGVEQAADPQPSAPQQALFPEQNALAQTQLKQLLIVIQLYKSLGGGWNQPDAPAPAK